MFKKIIFVFFALSIFTSHSIAGNEASIKQLLDELNYSLTVEWDQKDKSFYNAQVLQFNEGVKKLKAQGVTTNEMFRSVLESIKDKNLAREVEEIRMKLNLKLVSESQAIDMLKDAQNRSYSRGANWFWDSEAIPWVAGGLFLAVILAAGILGGFSTEGGGSSNGSTCYDESVCTSSYNIWNEWVEECTWKTVCY